MKEVNPINYSILIEPDLQRFRFSGKTIIVLEALEPVSEIMMNALELNVRRCVVGFEGEVSDCLFSTDAEKEVLGLTLPRAMKGGMTLTIDYEGVIGERMKGLYRSMYERDGVTHYVAVTQVCRDLAAPRPANQLIVGQCPSMGLQDPPWFQPDHWLLSVSPYQQGQITWAGAGKLLLRCHLRSN